MIIKKHFEVPVGDFYIARNIIKCLFKIETLKNIQIVIA